MTHHRLENSSLCTADWAAPHRPPLFIHSCNPLTAAACNPYAQQWPGVHQKCYQHRSGLLLAAVMSSASSPCARCWHTTNRKGLRGPFSLPR